MSQSTGEGLIDSVERLVGKMEKMYESQLAENERLEKMMTSLDSLSRVMARMESEKKYEVEFNRKIEILNESLHRVTSTQIQQSKMIEGEKTLDKIIQGAKMLGQVLSAVATGIQFSVENVGMVLKKDEENKRSYGASGSEPSQADLSMILQPLNNLVKNFVDEKKRQQEASVVMPSEGKDKNTAERVE